MLEYEDQLCDSLFVTHVQKYEAGVIKSFPSVSAISNGSQLKVAGSIVMNYYSIGVVLVQGNEINTWKDHDFPVLKAAVDVWLDKAKRSVIEMAESRNKSTLSVTSDDRHFSKASSSISVPTNTSPAPKVRTKRKKSARINVNSVKPMDRCSTPCHKPLNVTAPHLSPVTNRDVDSQTRGELSQTSNMESSVINTTHTTEDMPHKSPENTTGRATKLQHVQCLGDSSLDMLHADSVPTNNTIPEYNSDASSLHVSPNCEHCKHLQDYITICEETANTHREEIEKLKQHASSEIPPTPTPPPAIAYQQQPQNNTERKPTKP